MWSHWICDTISGLKLMPVFPSSESWRRVMNGIGSGTHTFQLRDAETALPRDVWRDLARTWARTVVTCWDEVPVYAGPIQHVKYHRPTGVLTLSTVEVRAILAKRMPFGVPGYVPNGASAVSGKSLRGVARQVVRWGTFMNAPEDDWYLPVVLPADEAGGESRSWPHHEFATVDDLLAEIQDTDGGPDIDCRPRWSGAGRLEWELRLGSPALSGSVFEWDLTAPEVNVFDFTHSRDGSKQLTGAFALGAGSGADMIVGQANNPGSPSGRIPNRDDKRSFKLLRTKPEADARAAAEVKAFREESELDEFKLLASEVLPGLLPGSQLRQWIEDDWFMADGWRSQIVAGMSGDLSEQIGVELL